jgi:uncharacterized protein YbjT (DUF2867 family)
MAFWRFLTYIHLGGAFFLPSYHPFVPGAVRTRTIPVGSEPWRATGGFERLRGEPSNHWAVSPALLLLGFIGGATAGALSLKHAPAPGRFSLRRSGGPVEHLQRRGRLAWDTRSFPVAMTVGATPAPRRVAVTGAGGKTGGLVFRKMLARPDEFAPVGIVRSEQSRSALIADGVPADCIRVADITSPLAIAAAVEGCSAVVIATSATPAPSGVTDESTGRPVFAFPNGQPEEVDWLGQKAQIDAAEAFGPETHVVICSSMGGTDPENMLNALGREKLPDGSYKGGNILLWKRKAEKYLIDSGLPYTVVHPGGLIDEAGGKREIVIGVDDDRTEGERSIPREDVAEVLLQAVLIPSYRNRTFDIRSKVEGEGEITTDFTALLDRLDGRNCDYSLGEIA